MSTAFVCVTRSALVTLLSEAISDFSAFAASSSAALALDFTVAKFPGVWTPSIAVLAVSFACATLSASFTDAASMACSP